MDSGPIAGRDYPKNWRQFIDRFGTDEGCLEWLSELRWADGFVCRSCGVVDRPRRATRDRRICVHCRKSITTTAGTVFEKTHTPLSVWFLSAWHFASSKQGLSALELQRTLGHADYETCWLILHKFRAALSQAERQPLSGVVEIDETFIGGVERYGPRSSAVKGKHQGRGMASKSIVVVACEDVGTAIGRIRLGIVPDATYPSLAQFVTANIAPGSTLRTDGFQGYKPFARNGYQHSSIPVQGSGHQAHELLPYVHRVASLLRRWLMATHQGAVDARYLQAYLDEYVFRFNRRNSTHRGLVFYRLLEACLNTGPQPLHAIKRTPTPQLVALQKRREAEKVAVRIAAEDYFDLTGEIEANPFF